MWFWFGLVFLIAEQYLNTGIIKHTNFYSCLSMLVQSIFLICGHMNLVVAGTGIAYVRQDYTKIIQCVYAITGFITCVSGNNEKT